MKQLCYLLALLALLTGCAQGSADHKAAEAPMKAEEAAVTTFDAG